MIYLTGSKSNAHTEHLDRGRIGLLRTPRSRYALKPGWVWAADNGCFSPDTYVGDGQWIAWLERQSREGCLFAVAPDVVGDAAATLQRSLPWLARIRELGFPAAFVAQDGIEHIDVPWDSFDVLFIGGTTDFKLGDVAASYSREAVARGKRVHLGRCNSRRRLIHAHNIGASSADGTFLAFAPSQNIPRMEMWLEGLDQHKGAPA